jgi:hypothetical protein
MQRSSRMTSTGFWADPAKTGQLDLAPGDLEGLSPAHRQQRQPARQAGHASSGQSPKPQ